MTTKKLTELLQDGGSFHMDLESACYLDWLRILTDAHADLTRQLCYYMEDGNEKKVDHCLKQIEEICKAWRKKGPKE